MICPFCGLDFPHNCAIEIGRRGKGITSEKKRASSRANIAKAREARKRTQDLDEQPIDLTKEE